MTKQIKKFLDEHPDAPFNIEISSFDNIQYKVVMIKYLQPEEEDLEVDGIGLEHKKLSFCIMYNGSLMNELGEHQDTINIEITNKKRLYYSQDDCTNKNKWKKMSFYSYN